MSETYKEFCIKVYADIFEEESCLLQEKALENAGGRKLSQKKIEEIERAAQKKAIASAAISTMKKYKKVLPASIWQAVQGAHMQRRSGISDLDLIEKVVSADQSWKKSSGHAFEEMLKQLSNMALKGTGIKVLLQRDITQMINKGELGNEEPDIALIQGWLAEDTFDLYAVIEQKGITKCFGCIQAKTSIRDRVTRDREPSIQAMSNYFWSIALVIDGEFLRGKFLDMVKGGTQSYEKNGWHGLYVFAPMSGERIYSVDMKMKVFREHAIQAADFWLHKRQWFNENWLAKQE